MKIWGSATACITCGRTGWHAEWCEAERRRQNRADVAQAQLDRGRSGRLGAGHGIRHAREFGTKP